MFGFAALMNIVLQNMSFVRYVYVEGELDIKTIPVNFVIEKTVGVESESLENSAKKCKLGTSPDSPADTKTQGIVCVCVYVCQVVDSYRICVLNKIGFLF